VAATRESFRSCGFLAAEAPTLSGLRHFRNGREGWLSAALAEQTR